MTEKFLKNDTGKPAFELLPFDILSGINDVLRYGANKYGSKNNWRKKEGFLCSRCYNALLRHIFAWWIKGEDNDPETGLSHLSHAMCNLIFLMYHFQNNKESDDRPIGDKK